MSHSPAPTFTPPSPTSGRGRDRRVLAYVGRHGAVSIEHLMVALGLGQAAAYRRAAALIDAGLLERLDLLRGEPSILRATRAGLRYAGLGMAPAVISPGSVDHWLRCASVALELEALHGAHRILTARELIFAERHEERPIASAKIGELPNGHPRLHRPDLVILPEDHPLVRHQMPRISGGSEDFRASGPSLAANVRTREGGGEEACTEDLRPSPAAHARTREQAREISGDHGRAPAGAEDMGVAAIEVELTPKSPKRLREIVRGWRRASRVEEVRYLCEPGQTHRAVKRAVEKLHAADRIQVRELSR